MKFHWQPRIVRTIPNGQYGSALREPRQGVMLHYDGSSSDAGAANWFADPACRVSYQTLVLDDGNLVRIAPDTARAWHAGYCRASDPRLTYQDANSAFYGVSAATTDGVDVTIPQMLGVAWQTYRWFIAEGWDADEMWRIVSHASEAVYPPGHPRAGQRGRKSDPEGHDAKNPIMTVADIRFLVAALFTTNPARMS